MGIDYGLVVPDDTKTLAQGAVKPWQSPSYEECQSDMMRCARFGLHTVNQVNRIILSAQSIGPCEKWCNTNARPNPKLCGTGVAALTRSAKGSVVVADGEQVAVPAERVDRVVDTTGAGDLYAAGFLYGLTQGKGWSDCARLGRLRAPRVARARFRRFLPR